MRQVLYWAVDIGKVKTAAAKRYIDEFKAGVDVVAYVLAVSAENADQVMENCDSVHEGTDVFATGWVVNAACLRKVSR